MRQCFEAIISHCLYFGIMTLVELLLELVRQRPDKVGMMFGQSIQSSIKTYKINK